MDILEKLRAAEKEYFSKQPTPPKPRDARRQYDDIVRHKEDRLYDIETDRAERMSDTYRDFQEQLERLREWAKLNGLIDASGLYPWEEDYELV